MTMKIQTFFHTETATFTYIVADVNTKKCIIIDPVQDFDLCTGRTSMKTADLHLNWIIENGYELKFILETHIHADHLTAAYYLKEKTGAQIGIGKHIIDVLKTWVPIFNTVEDTPIDGSQFDMLFDDGDIMELGSLKIHVLHTPGHTPACVSYYINNSIFVGDTILMPYIGTSRTDFPGGSADTLYNSIQKILSLPDSTKIYTCHDYPAQGLQPCSQTTVKGQKLTNIMINEDEFIAKRNARDVTLTLPRLLFPSIQINMRCGKHGKIENQSQYIKIPLNKL
jgi:glyoxylase-like metal-dependent hydrolase (beta-lactamase superfamily II)